MELLTNSRMKVARLCLRKDLYSYQLGYRPAVTDDNLRFGTLAHLGLEAWFGAAMRGEANRLGAALTALDGEADPFERVRAEEMLRGYDARWRDEPMDVLAVEVRFEAALTNPETGAPSKTWRLAGKLDAVIRDAHGRTLIVEHKTSSEDIGQGSDYCRRQRMDGQISTYYEGARTLGHDVEGCLYDVLGKPGIRPFKATPIDARKFTKDGRLYANQHAEDETPEEFRLRVCEAIATDPNRYFQRGEVVRLEGEMREHLTDIWQFGQGLRDWVRMGRAPRNPDACVYFGKTCSFFPVCTGEASLDDTTRFVKFNTAHPELAPAPDGA